MERFRATEAVIPREACKVSVWGTTLGLMRCVRKFEPALGGSRRSRRSERRRLQILKDH
jgi:hypothetical protein